MKFFKPLILILAVLGIGAGLVWYWRHGIFYPSTDDAYLQANIATIAPQVGGRVERLEVSDNIHVSAGDVLFTIESSSLQAAVDAAQAQLDLAILGADAASSAVAVAEAELASADASLAHAEVALARARNLASRNDLAQSALDDAQAVRDRAAAARDSAAANLAMARAQAGTDEAGAAPAVQAARAALDQALIDLSHAVVTAPADGWIANLTLRAGQVVARDQPLFSLVEDGEWWVDGNFKETDLDRIRPGQPVRLSVDMYPGLDLSGVVESIGAGSGAVFSLLPAQNATGNWVKVTQRFPVRIRLLKPPTDPARQLRVGASVTATVDTTTGAGR